MMPRNALFERLLLAAALALACASCAVQGGSSSGEAPGPGYTPPPQNAAARVGLAAPLRPFYDALEEYGDWVLVEPAGWVFRPRVNTVAWRPYQEGHWEPSYSFGWVWVSDDPFGWITDHYGFWFYDDFQGWLWQPYGAWAPSWVAWVQVGNYVGWAPLPPASAPTPNDIPGGVFTYLPRQSLAQPGVATSSLHVNSLPDDGSALVPIERNVSYMGTYYNAGPDLNEVLGAGSTDRLRLAEREGKVDVPTPSRKFTAAGPAPSLDVVKLEERTRRMMSEAHREFTTVHAQRGGLSHPPANPPVVSVPPAPAPAQPPKYKPAPGDTLKETAPPDSTKHHKHPPKKPAKPPGSDTN